MNKQTPSYHFFHVIVGEIGDHKDNEVLYWDELTNYDYTVYGYYSIELDKLIYLEDNTHSDPIGFWEAFKTGILVTGAEVFYERYYIEVEHPYNGTEVVEKIRKGDMYEILD